LSLLIKLWELFSVENTNMGIVDTNIDSELLQEFFRKNGNAMKLLSEVFNLANKLAINGYGDEAVKMHQICTQISRKIEKLDNLNK